MSRYASVICEHCPCTDFGSASVGTDPGSTSVGRDRWNMCGGSHSHCAEALDNYNEGLDEEDRIPSVEDVF